MCITGALLGSSGRNFTRLHEIHAEFLLSLFLIRRHKLVKVCKIRSVCLSIHSTLTYSILSYNDLSTQQLIPQKRFCKSFPTNWTLHCKIHFNFSYFQLSWIITAPIKTLQSGNLQKFRVFPQQVN